DGIYETSRGTSRVRRVLNLYGPTEDTTYSTVQEVRSGDVAEPPIGRPIAGGLGVVLSRDGHPVIRGAVGELCLGGAGLARGYLGRPDLTAERFVPSGFDRNGEAGSRLYRTGDLVRQLADGSLVYLGRIDHQVKVRGFRIEMGEVEAALRALPGVREAVVVVHDAPAGKGLAAYLAGDGLADGGEQSLREALASRLPAYMVPAWIVVLPALPLTPNGKVDRRALPAPAMAAQEARGAAARPRTPTEELLAGIWADLLGLPLGAAVIAPQDSFFHLGGHSLLAAQVLSRVRETLGVELGLARFFEVPTLGGLAAEVDRRRREQAGSAPSAPPLARVPRGDGPLPLAPAQERLWFMDQMEPDSSAYNIPGAVRLRGPLDVPALASALAGIVARHEALRTRFGVADARPVQVIQPAAEMDLQLPVADLAALDSVAREAELLRLATAEAARAFDLAAGPLLRVLLVRLTRPASGTSPEAEHALLITLHHIVSDGWSLGVFVRELAALYGAAGQPGRAALPPLALQYADFAVWQRRWLEEEGEMERQLAFWRLYLAGAPAVLELPLDRPRSAAGSRDQRGARLTLRLTAAEAQAAGGLARAEGATLFLVLLAALDALLLRHTGQEDLVVGSPVAGRDRLELEPLIGLFVNTLVLRCAAGGDPTVREMLARVRSAALGAWTHQDIPFDRLVEAVAPQRDPSHSPLFQVMLAAQPDVLGGLEGLERAGLAVAPLEVPVASAKFDLAVGIAEPADGSVVLHWVYRTALFDAPTVARLASHFGRLLAAVAAGPERRLSALPMLADAERHQLVHEWDGLAVESAAESAAESGGEAAVPFAHELIAAQMRCQPGAPALEMAAAGEGASAVLTYGELDAMVSRLARRLRRLGIGPEDRVALFLERSFETIAGLLAVLRTGAAYVPLDPALPVERLAFLLADARPAAVLTQEHLAARLAEPLAAAGALGVPVLRVDAQADEAADGMPVSMPPFDPLAAAYVIYTSGSTGQAKGVVVSHGALGRRIRTLAAELAGELGSPLRFLHKTTLSFDASVGEVFGPLAAGGTMILAAPGGERDQGYLVGLIRELDVTHVSFTASTLGVLVEQPGFGACRSLRMVLTGAETVPADLPGRFAARLDARLFNRYGPTETTISVISDRCEPGSAPGSDPGSDRAPLPPPLGRPIPGAGILLLGRRLEPVPARALGEICVGGGYLARGYLGRPDLTAERFVPHPFSPRPGARLYRTGDLARFRPDGRLEFVGRADQQVKIRGFRVELGEIETVLAAHPGVREAVVAARSRGDRTTDLVAYVVPHGGPGAVEAAALRELARERLPAYMVPAAFVLLERLPLSPSGKVDRRALPAPPAPDTEMGDAFEAPGTPVEEALAAIWREVLGVQRVGVRDDFFELGGHSLQVTQVLLRVRDLLGVEIGVQRFFEQPTVGELALALSEELVRQRGAEPAARSLAELGALSARGPESGATRPAAGDAADAADAAHGGETGPPPVRRVGRDRLLPLSFGQERLWFLHQLEPESAVFNLPVAVRLTGDLDVAALAASLSEIVRRHESLRTVFATVENSWPGQPNGAEQPARPPRPPRPPMVQVISPPAPVALPVLDLSDEPDREEQARRRFAADAERPFDLAAGPLLRASLMRLGAREHLLLLNLHHIVSDGWSAGVLVRELGALYAAAREGRGSPLAELPVQYADYAVWQRGWLAGEVLARQLDWWRARLAGMPAVLELPADRPRPPAQSSRGAAVPVAVADCDLAGFARRRGATPYMALLAGFQALLARYGAGDDVPVGSPVANRNRPELEELIGFFVNT
ncbi:MAG TPA: amino acid adenylation domain-containing protein, partial [Thermoanaerobaculia bacterium]|nr:amino acid adenylation domain-containing protein [Thermoanaerobaculia bacterium]